MVQKERSQDAEEILQKIARSKKINFDGNFLTSQGEVVPLTDEITTRQPGGSEGHVMSPQTRQEQISNEGTRVCTSEVVSKQSSPILSSSGGENLHKITTEEKPMSSSEEVGGNMSDMFSQRRKDGMDEPTSTSQRDDGITPIEYLTGSNTETRKAITRYTIFDLFRTKVLVKNTSIIFYLW